FLMRAPTTVIYTLSLHDALPISSNYLHQRDQQLSGNVVLIGSGQSAAEIFIDLFDRQIHPMTGQAKFHLYWLTRSAGFFPMENRSEEPRLNSSHVKISYAVFCLK